MGQAEQRLQAFGNIPIRHHTLLMALRDYKTPNNKISRWLDEGVLLPIKRGLYVVSPTLTSKPIQKMLIANVLYGPSCVSLDYALWHYGLIPESVLEITSVTPQRSLTQVTEIGRFSYQHVPYDLYTIDIQSVALSNDVYALLASPAKALCDRLLLTRQLRIHSIKSMQRFLVDDLRLDTDEVDLINLSTIESYQQTGHKTELLTHLHGAIRQWQ